MTSATVNWEAYAAAYDLMADHNPAYQELLGLFAEQANNWELSPGDTVLDLGAGTGNFSLRCAAMFPMAQVIHVDGNRAMLARARAKARRAGLGNLRLLRSDSQAVVFEPGSLSAVICVHALYAFPDPGQTIRRIHSWLRPGGYFFACDPGREPDVGDWAKYLFGDWVRRDGLIQAALRCLRGREIARQNRAIARMQQSGGFWRHDLESFTALLRQTGFAIGSSGTCYRKCSDWASCRKQEPPAGSCSVRQMNC